MTWCDDSISNPDITGTEARWGDQTWEDMQYMGILFSVPGRRLRP